MRGTPDGAGGRVWTAGQGQGLCLLLVSYGENLGDTLCGGGDLLRGCLGLHLLAEEGDVLDGLQLAGVAEEPKEEEEKKDSCYNGATMCDKKRCVNLLVAVAFSLYFSQNVHSVVISKCPRHLVIVH